MPVAVILLAFAYFERSTIIATAAFILLCKLVTLYRRSKLDLRFSKTNSLF